MYPHSELKALALRKRLLQRGIGERRAACAQAAARTVQPLAWVDRAFALIKRVAPVLPVLCAPLALLATRRLNAKSSLFRSVIKWGPVIFQATRFARSTLAANPSAYRARRPL